VAQVIELLPIKYKALSSNLCTTCVCVCVCVCVCTNMYIHTYGSHMLDHGLSYISITCGTLENTNSHQALEAHAGNSSYQEAEIKRIMVLGQHGQIVCKTLSRKYPAQRSKFSAQLTHIF
jgi:hypothetical protein